MKIIKVEDFLVDIINMQKILIKKYFYLLLENVALTWLTVMPAIEVTMVITGRPVREATGIMAAVAVPTCSGSVFLVVQWALHAAARTVTLSVVSKNNIFSIVTILFVYQPYSNCVLFVKKSINSPLEIRIS